MSWAPFFYRNLVDDNKIITKIETYDGALIDGHTIVESVVFLSDEVRGNYFPPVSNVYSSGDGAGASKFKNISIHKAISESLERWAFYQSLAESPAEYLLDIVPYSTGIAAFPSFFTNPSRDNAKKEATERWALHQFWTEKIPLVEHDTSVKNLKHYELITGMEFKTSILQFEDMGEFFYGFSSGRNLNDSFSHAMIELSRNWRVLKDYAKNENDELNIYEKRLLFFKKSEGSNLFREKILRAPMKRLIDHTVLVDKEIKGPWSKYAKVWRFLYSDSFNSDLNDETFFMF